MSAIDLLMQHNITYTKFGLKGIPSSNLISVYEESQVIFGVTLPGVQIDCALSQVVASEWPYIWSFCDVSSSFTNICYDESITEYSVYINNPTDQYLHIDTLKIETTHQTDVIWIEHWCGSTNINLEYPMGEDENYTCSNNQKSWASISIKKSSISVNLKDIHNIEAHEIQINDIHDTNITNTCSKGVDSFPYILVINEAKSWFEAQEFCESINSNLATIRTEEELAMIVELNEVYSLTKVWIGLNDINNNRNFTWIDGTKCDYTETGLCVDNTFWQKGEPSPYGFGTDCVQLNTFIEDGSFNDVLCENALSFYCGLASNVSIFHLSNSVVSTPTPMDNISNVDEGGNSFNGLAMIIICIFCGVVFIMLIMQVRKNRKLKKLLTGSMRSGMEEAPSTSGSEKKSTSSNGTSSSEEYSHTNSGKLSEMINKENKEICDKDRERIVSIEMDTTDELLNGDNDSDDITFACMDAENCV